MRAFSPAAHALEKAEVKCGEVTVKLRGEESTYHRVYTEELLYPTFKKNLANIIVGISIIIKFLLKVILRITGIPSLTSEG